jgi:hypothetical protein
LHREVIPIYVNARDMIRDQLFVLSQGVVLCWLAVRRARFPDCADNQLLDLGGGDPVELSGLVGLPLKLDRRNIVPVADPGFGGIGRRHAIAAFVEDPAHQQRVRCLPGYGVMGALSPKICLHRVEQLAVENGPLCSRKNLTLVGDFADIKSVAQEISEGTTGERDASDGPSGGQRPNLGFNPSGSEVSQ